jgi:DNA polymerase alpha subunit B N-terminal
MSASFGKRCSHNSRGRQSRQRAQLLRGRFDPLEKVSVVGTRLSAICEYWCLLELRTTSIDAHNSLDMPTTPLARRDRQSLGTPGPSTVRARATPSLLTPSSAPSGRPEGILSTPAQPEPAFSPATPLSRFETRVNALEVVETLNPDLPAATPSTATHSRAEFAPITPPEKTTEDYKYRYMFEKVTEKSEGMLLPA